MLLNLLFIGTTIYSSSSAALTYSVDEKFSGIWAGIFGSPTSLFTHIASSPSIVSGDPSLFNFFPKSILTTDVIENVTTCAPCTSIQVLNSGDKIFTTNTIAFNGGSVPSANTPGLFDNLYKGTITITGGTGLFKNATGGGNYFATDFGAINDDGKGNISFNSFGKWDFEQNITVNTAPVPEPEIYAMMMAGLGLMGFVARRRKSQFA